MKRIFCARPAACSLEKFSSGRLEMTAPTDLTGSGRPAMSFRAMLLLFNWNLYSSGCLDRHATENLLPHGFDLELFCTSAFSTVCRVSQSSQHGSQFSPVKLVRAAGQMASRFFMVVSNASS